MTFTEDWFSEASQVALGLLFDRVRDLNGAVVEVGCWEGRSTVALANACHPAALHAVDTWQGSPGEISADLAQERDVLATFKSNVGELTQGNVEIHRMGWRDYFDLHHCGSNPIRFLHIDATHTYSEVFDNIAAALPHLVPGAVVCGDDVHHPPIQRAVLDHFGAYGKVATLWWVQT